MPNLAYINGSYCNKNLAKTFIDDRGYQFGDAVYEVFVYRDGKFLDYIGHIKRLKNSLKSLDIRFKMSDKSLLIIIKHLLRINKVRFGLIYIQISRGIANRDHSFYKSKLFPVLVITVKRFKNDFQQSIEAINTITLKDTRWSNANIKTIQLLPNALAKTKAKSKNADEAIFVDYSDYITEGASSNVWILTHKNILKTRNLDGSILPGITRNTILKCAKKNKISVREEKFKIDDLYNAKEVFITSASSFVTPVKKVNETLINNGITGYFANKLRIEYFNSNS